MCFGWPANLTWYKLLTDWGSLIAGSFGFAAAIIAVWLAIGSERRKARRELESLRRALGVEVRLLMYNAYRAHDQLKTLLTARPPFPTAENVTNRISASFVEDKTKLPEPQIYPQASFKISEFGDCAANIVLFYHRITVTRDAAERLLRHPSSSNLPSGEIAAAVDRMILIAQVGTDLVPHLKTGIASQDDRDEYVTQQITKAIADWNGRRAAYHLS